MGDDMSFEVGGCAVKAPLHVDEGIGAAAVVRSTVLAFRLPSVITLPLGFFPQ